MQDKPMDDPYDAIDLENLDGWIYCNDSSRMRKTDNRKGLEGSSRDRHQDSWIRFDNG